MRKKLIGRNRDENGGFRSFFSPNQSAREGDDSQRRYEGYDPNKREPLLNDEKEEIYESMECKY